MKNILIHGLGQNSQDWNTVKTELEIKGYFQSPRIYLNSQKAGN